MWIIIKDEKLIFLFLELFFAFYCYWKRFILFFLNTVVQIFLCISHDRWSLRGHFFSFRISLWRICGKEKKKKKKMVKQHDRFLNLKVMKWLVFTTDGHRQKQIRAISVLSNESRSSSFRRCRSIFSTTCLSGQIFAARFESPEVSESSERVEPKRLLRAYCDRLIVHNWQGIKRTESKSKIGTLHFETWLFDERIHRSDELGVTSDRFDKWFDRFANFFVYSLSTTMICLVSNLFWPVVLLTSGKYVAFNFLKRYFHKSYCKRISGTKVDDKW